MKLYAKTTSERATKGQGGNEYINIDIFTTDKDRCSHRLRIINDDTIGEINLSLQARHFEIWRTLAEDKILINVNKKGKKQTGECEHIDCIKIGKDKQCQKCGQWFK